MPTTPANLITRAADPIKAATASYLKTRNAAQFETAMQKALATHHTAAYLRGLAERSAGGRVKVWLSKVTGINIFSKAEKAALKRQIADQFGFLKDFVAALTNLSDAQIVARAAQYAGAVQGAYWQAHYPDLPFQPGDGGTECKGHCGCSWIDNGGGSFTWKLSSGESCAGCKERASGSPYQAKA